MSRQSSKSSRSRAIRAWVAAHTPLAQVVLASCLVTSLVATLSPLGSDPAGADSSAWPEICVAQTAATLKSPAQPFATYSIPWEPELTLSGGSTVASSPADGSYIIDPQTGQAGTWLDAQPYGDGVELDTWQWPATGSYVSPFDNAHGTGTSTTLTNGTVNNDGSTAAPGYPLSITTPLLYPPGSPAGTPGTVEPFTSSALQTTVVTGGPTFATMPLRMNVLLPPGYSSNTNTSYPVLYLVAGSGNDSGFSSYLWTGQGSYNGVNLGPDVEQDMAAAAAAGHPMIVVMPDDSYSGLSTNWDDLDSQQASVPGNNPDATATEPTPQWQSFFLGQVVPFIDTQYRVETSGSGQFIAGVSAGGGTAMSYVGAVDQDQHFHTGPYQNLAFGAAGSFSGAQDFFALGAFGDYESIFAAGEAYWTGSDSGTVPTATAVMDGPDNMCAEGSATTANPPGNPSEIAQWQALDPTFQAMTYPDTQTHMFITSGEGALGLNGPQDVEYYVGTMTENFVAALAGTPNPENPLDRTWTQYNTGFLDNSGGTPTGQATLSGFGPANNCTYVAGQNCVNIYSGGSHSPEYWIPDLASFFNWLEPQANPTTS